MLITSTTRVAGVLCLLLHLFFFAAFAFSIFPPDMFLVRGEPATLQPGLEWAFPKLAAIIYAALSSGVAYALYRNTPGAMKTSALPCIVYHICGIGLYVFGKGGEALNKEKTSILAISMTHSILCLPAIISFLFSSPEWKKED